jgi:hypothetical protein
MREPCRPDLIFSDVMDAGVLTGGAVMPVLLDCALPLTSRRPNDRVGVQFVFLVLVKFLNWYTGLY